MGGGSSRSDLTLAFQTSAGSEMDGNVGSTIFRWPRSPRGTPWGLKHISLRMIVARNLFADFDCVPKMLRSLGCLNSFWGLTISTSCLTWSRSAWPIFWRSRSAGTGKIGKECGASDLPARRCCQLRVYPGSGIHDCRYSGGDGPHCRRSDNRHGVYRWGAILRLKDSVKGTATAASLWITGAIGAAVGLGSLDVAIMLSVITVATLWIMAPLKHFGHLEQEDGSDEVRKEK